MADAQHTPTPWLLDGRLVYSLQDDARGRPTNRFSAHLDPGFGRDGLTPDTELDANAAFIVRACNAHEALVAALKGVLRVADRKTDEFDAARAALRLAEGK